MRRIGVAVVEKEVDDEDFKNTGRVFLKRKGACPFPLLVRREAYPARLHTGQLFEPWPISWPAGATGTGCPALHQVANEENGPTS